MLRVKIVRRDHTCLVTWCNVLAFDHTGWIITGPRLCPAQLFGLVGAVHSLPTAFPPSYPQYVVVGCSDGTISCVFGAASLKGCSAPLRRQSFNGEGLTCSRSTT